MKKMYFLNLNFNADIDQRYIQVDSTLKQFPCGEYEFTLNEDIEDKEITIFQSFTIGEFNDDLIKLQIVCNVLKQNNAKKITYFSPFLPYTRQDKFNNTKVSSGANILTPIIEHSNINEIITYDLHSQGVENLFKCKIQNLSMIPIFILDIKHKFNKNNIIIIFPDKGAELRFKNFFLDESFQTATIKKNRESGKIQMTLLGCVKNKIAIIIDDMVDSGNTIISAASLLKANGATEINAYVTHGILGPDKLKNIHKSDLTNLHTSTTLTHCNDNILPLKTDDYQTST